MAGLTRSNAVALGVVAHESRRDRAVYMAVELKAAAVNVDDGTLGCAKNHIKVLQQFDGIEADWCCVLEDDAVPVRHFNGELKRALAHAPSPIDGLYLGTGNPSGEVQIQIRQAVITAQEKRHAWLLGDCLIGSVGYAIHAGLRDDMLEYIWSRTEELPLRISRWAQARDIPICYTMPSLVNHEDHDTVDGPAVRSERKAWAYNTHVDWVHWNTPSVQLGHCPGWSAERATT